MASADVKIDIATEFTGKKAFNQADKATQKLSGGVKKLAAGLGVAFGARALANYGKNAVKAFAEDEKAAKALTLTLNNLGLAFADPAVKQFISRLEEQYAVADDKLRPAYQKLLTTTGDYVKAQDLLTTGLDLAAMSGQDILTVTADLSKAYAGNTKGLSKYGLGLSKTELAAMSFEEILAQIAKVSTGQAQAAADSYAGSLAKLNIAAENASESIGKDLITAISTLGGEGGLPKVIDMIASVASGIGDAAIGLSRLIRNANIFITGGDKSLNALDAIKEIRRLDAIDRAADEAERKAEEKANRLYGGVYAEQYKTLAKTVVIKKKLTDSELKALQAARLKLALEKANLALLKGGEIFDMDKIQIAAALTNQAEALGKATTSSQVLAIANDVARLNVKKSILALDDAIASGDQKAIEAATAKLNADIAILGKLQQQSVKLLDIKSILASLKPADLINQSNLDMALAKIKEMLALLAKAQGQSTAAVPTSGTSGSGIPIGDYVAPISMATGLAASTDALLEYADAAGARANAFADLLDLQYAADLAALQASGLLQTAGAAGGLQSFRASESAAMNITVNTGIGDPEAIARAIEEYLRSSRARGTSMVGGLQDALDSRLAHYCRQYDL